MQSSNVNNNNQGNLDTPLPMDSSSDSQNFQVYLAQLESSGFTNKKRNLKLLTKTNGNFEVVKQFLIAHDQFRRVVKENKKSAREERLRLRLVKKGSRSDTSTSDSSDQDKRIKKEKKWAKKYDEEHSSSDKVQKKALKKAFKEEVKRLKLERKMNKRSESGKDSLDEEEKAALKREKKALKSLYKERKNNAPVPTELPEGSATVYLDGNNMLYVIRPIRDRCINRRTGASADRLLEAVVRAWSNKLKAIKVILIFDNVNYSVEEDEFCLCSARPKFPTSDDALIYWSQQMQPEQAQHTVIFTSDVKLTAELVKSKVQVIKSKAWFEIASKALGRLEGESLDDWGERWIVENVDQNRTFRN